MSGGSKRPSHAIGARLAALARAATIASVVCAALVSVPVAVVGLLDPSIAVEQEGRDLAGLLGPGALSDDRPGGGLRTFATEREIAGYLDGLDLPTGSVLLDVFEGFAIVGQSTRPSQFVITPDRDFQAVLADPRSFGVRYLLAPPKNGLGAVDAVNVAYPSLSSDGAGFAVLERTFAGREGGSDWALYRVASP